MEKRVYKDFEPHFEWMHDTSTTVLRIDVPGFKKEQLRVQIENTRTIKVSGERPLTESVGNNRWSRFRSVFPLPNDCSSGGIRARFDSGHLYVVMPKLPPPLLPSQSQQMAAPDGRHGGMDSSVGATPRAPSSFSYGGGGERPEWARTRTSGKEYSAGRERQELRELEESDGYGYSPMKRRSTSTKGVLIKTMLFLLILSGIGLGIYYQYMLAKEAAAQSDGGAATTTGDER